MADQIIDKALNYIGEKLPNINVVTAYGRVSKAVSATTTTTVNTVTLTTGRWLVLSYMQLSASGSGSTSYNHVLAGRSVRSTPHNGGGSVNFAYVNVTGASSNMVVQAYTPMACTVQNDIVAIKLGGG